MYRRTVFTHEDWFKHRSTDRYKRHITGFVGSRIVRSLAWPVGFVVFNSTILVIYESLREGHVLPPWCPGLVLSSAEPFTLTSLTLSLLLVFRTNASYARWADARKIWGGVVNRTRDIVRQGLTWVSPEKEEMKDMLQRWAIAYPRALKAHLTFEIDLESELKNILLKDELDALMTAKHRPNYVTRVLAEIINASKLSEREVFLMDANLTSFMDATGGCERIFKTPIPLSWTRHTSRFLMIWLTFLPFILYRTCHWGTPVAGAIIAFSLLACDEISVSLEEPFSILALDSMCDGIESSIKEMGRQRGECEALVQNHMPLGGQNSPAGSHPAKAAVNSR